MGASAILKYIVILFIPLDWDLRHTEFWVWAYLLQNHLSLWLVWWWPITVTAEYIEHEHFLLFFQFQIWKFPDLSMYLSIYLYIHHFQYFLLFKISNLKNLQQSLFIWLSVYLLMYTLLVWGVSCSLAPERFGPWEGPWELRSLGISESMPLPNPEYAAVSGPQKATVSHLLRK